MGVRHEFLEPDRFVVGSIGDIPERVYVLQVREDRRLLTMPCDPMQLEALADHVERVLDEVAEISHGVIAVPPAIAVAADNDPLDLPLEQDFTVATMAIGWDALRQMLHLELFSEAGGVPTTPDPSLTGEQLAQAEAGRAEEMCSLSLSPAMGREFVARARTVLAADLPACPLCQQPIRGGGHVCPRRNGYLGRSAWQPRPEDGGAAGDAG